MIIEKCTRGTSVGSSIKGFTCKKDGHGAFKALIANHAGETKYCSIMKKKNASTTDDQMEWTLFCIRSSCIKVLQCS
jgi:hypothetical protein